jgi:hypothetical protein
VTLYKLGDSLCWWARRSGDTSKPNLVWHPRGKELLQFPVERNPSVSAALNPAVCLAAGCIAPSLLLVRLSLLAVVAVGRTWLSCLPTNNGKLSPCLFTKVHTALHKIICLLVCYCLSHAAILTSKAVLRLQRIKRWSSQAWSFPNIDEHT